jgi:preprotein translocase subunit SecA
MSSGRTNALPSPGLLWGPYPERRVPRRDGLVALAEGFGVRLDLPGSLLQRRYQRFATRVGECRLLWARDDSTALDVRRRTLQPILARDGLRGEPLVEAFALAALQCQRMLGLVPFDTQIIAARAMLDNRLVEMATGEGKTLAVALAASVAAMAGMPVHVITANDYLVERDAEHLGPFYAVLGLDVGRITARHDAGARRAAYARDIVYCTAKEIGFDYLRDRIAGKRRGDDLQRRVEQLTTASTRTTLLRGLCMAIVDEADSVLIDEARVPLILSRSADNERAADEYAQALALAGQLAEGTDFELDHEMRRVSIGDPGSARLAGAAAELPTVWRNRRFREEWVRQALSALHLFRRDRDYIVRDGRVEIVDPTTGRVAVGRSWSRGLHQLIELKEGCEATPDHVVAAQITFQRLFRRYHRLAGLSGTLRESARELAKVYRLRLFRVPLRLPLQRRVMPTRPFPDRQSLWQAVAARIGELRALGQPVLVGTDSVADSEALAAVLAGDGIPCRVLNARQDREEAEVVALAGLRGQVTVTTNMAGRGTDIPLGPGVERLGGLHVISCQHNAARRIDRQLLGRCARQGHAGSVESMLCLDADLFLKHWPESWLARLRQALDRAPAQRVAIVLERIAQRREEARDATARRQLLRADEQAERQLAFGGSME